jgi:hypothetical protein
MHGCIGGVCMGENGQSQTRRSSKGAARPLPAGDDLVPPTLGMIVKLGLTTDLTAVLCERVVPGARAYLPLGHDEFVQLGICLLGAVIIAEYLDFGRSVVIAVKRILAKSKQPPPADKR